MTTPVATTLHQILLSFSSLAIPEPTRSNSWGFIHHLLVCLLPIYDVLLGRTPILPPPTSSIKSPLSFLVRWHCITVAFYVLFSVTIATPVSFVTGVNWGWTLGFSSSSHDKVFKLLHLDGPNYRLVWFLYVNILFAVIRLLHLGNDWFFRKAGWSPYSLWIPNNKRKTQ
ncbi:expressed unknown protein [Seminavis robusta]|uniref:Uncharacterized protein n=1 Tax=Seminavis robusta TaxID=568900 RepID=A0A9N8E6G1_9STRA|nr:expressed unknown protein [Seminavis robusta]|eukprot:Sro722_g192860.1 n/a (170) ;mRNA; r:21992-22501